MKKCQFVFVKKYSLFKINIEKLHSSLVLKNKKSAASA